MSNFWKNYARVNDDIRHELVEKAWSGRQTTGDIDQKDMPGIAPSGPTNEPSAPLKGGTIYATPGAPSIEQVEVGMDVAREVGGATIQSPEIEEPTIEAPEIGPDPEI